MKSRVITTFRAMSPRPPRALSRLFDSRPVSRISRTGVAFGATLCALTLSGCYYPYGYYPSGYYSPYYTAVPATAVQQDVPAGQANSSDPQAQQQAQAQASTQVVPQTATYAVAAPPPVYVAPPYPAYYPPPVYPYYGYPAYYGPSVSIGIGGYWGGGWGHYHHWH
jgi:hypothetical protein